MSAYSKHLAILQRGLELTALFMFVLASLLFLSWALLLPKFTQISLEGEDYSVNTLTQLQSSLQASITDLKLRRNTVLTPISDDQYSELKEEQVGEPALSQIRQQIAEAIEPLKRDGESLIKIYSLEYRGATNQVGMRGQILDNSAQSMTIFARLVAALEQVTFVNQIDRSRLNRGPDLTTFDIVLHL